VAVFLKRIAADKALSTAIEANLACEKGGAWRVEVRAAPLVAVAGDLIGMCGMLRGVDGGILPTSVSRQREQMRTLAPPPRLLHCCRRAPITPLQPYKRTLKSEAPTTLSANRQWPLWPR
jgi:hypothetical protein